MTQAEPEIVWESYHEHPGLWPIAYRLAAMPGQQFVVYFPECMTSREFVNFWQHRTTWAIEGPEARASAQAPEYAHEVVLRYRQGPGELRLDWTCAFENRTAGALHDLAAFNCVFLANAPLFKDTGMARTWCRDESGALVRLDTVAKTKAPRTLQFYPVAGGADLPRCAWLATLEAACSRRLSGDRIWVDSVDGRWRLETIVEGPVAYFFNNWEDDHGCIHAAPLLGTVEPGATATVRGCVRIAAI